jgi:2-amino-4-hydroxy-6-hydroxymethyldihydropteridine diphosphokinase
MSASSSSVSVRTMPEVFVGCGSNLEPVRHLRWALSEFERHFGALICSSVYQSPAYGFEGPDFLNLVVAFRAESDVDAVDAVLSSLETARGRSAGNRSGSRTLDLDLLLYGERVDAARRLPRTDILRYPFVLAPLAEIAPGLRHPVTGASMREAWAARAPQVGRLTLVDSLDAA